MRLAIASSRRQCYGTGLADSTAYSVRPLIIVVHRPVGQFSAYELQGVYRNADDEFLRCPLPERLSALS